MRYLLLAAVVVLLAGCAPLPTGEPAPTTQTRLADVTWGVTRVVDEEAGVVCYYMAGSAGKAIDCLPIGETLLDAGSR